MERVAVTGIGIVSSIGLGKDEFWTNAIAGKNGINYVKQFDTSEYHTNLGGEIKNFVPYINNIKVDDIGRCSQYAVSAVNMAYDDAKVKNDPYLLAETEIFMGTTLGEVQELGKSIRKTIMGDKKKGIELFAKYPVHNILSAVCDELNIQGKAILIPNACAAGNFALISAYERIRNEKCRCAFAGGADALSESAYRGFSKLRSLAKDKCSPFDKNRQGMIIGEGAGVLFLESMSCARKRNAHIYAEIVGWGAGCDAYNMVMPRPDASGIKKVMKEAIEFSGVSDIDYICAHGTGTHANDVAESKAINDIFGNKIPVSSVKSMIGHTMGAASAIESAVCCLAIHDNVIPPTINYDTYDEKCNIDCVANKARRVKVHTAMNNAYAFGGNNTCILFSEVSNG